MDSAWNGILTCTTSESRPHASSLERELSHDPDCLGPALPLQPLPSGSIRRARNVDVPDLTTTSWAHGFNTAWLTGPVPCADGTGQPRRAGRRRALDRAELSLPVSGPSTNLTADLAAAQQQSEPPCSAHIVTGSYQKNKGKPR